MMLNPIDPTNDDAGTVSPAGYLRAVCSKRSSKRTPGSVPCARLVGALLSLTVLLPVLASGQGIGGGTNFCAVLGPCGAGFGDCDGDQECQAGLVCRNDVGADYGFAADIDVCEARAVGDGDYCAVNGPCEAGEGDCDGNHECQTGLVCRNNVGADYGFAANIDVCEVLPLPDLGSNHYCLLAGPCEAGEGDCDGNHECQAGLVCHNNIGADYGFGSFIDVCEPPALGSTNYCTVAGPCEAGEGDCDSNDECQTGLACRNDVGATYGFPALIDVCEPPVAGSNDFCAVSGPCGVAEGDCDSNDECQDGLVCRHDVGANYGYRAVVDVCEAGPQT